ncbi:MAG: hypothetical protein HZA01_12765 [Nitrospinae bacterium]|nr:hypothetical protein [Nitrospinota bacterium]
MKMFKFFSRLIALTAWFLQFPGTVDAFEFGNVHFHGYLDMEYTKADRNWSGQHNYKNGSFDAHHFNLVLDAPVNEKLLVAAMIGMEHGLDQSAIGFNNGRIVTEYAFGQYAFADYFKIRAGKMLTPYGFLNEIHDATPALLTVEAPLTLYSAQKRGGEAIFPEWSTGAGVLGNFFLFEDMGLDYVFYIANGENTGQTNEAEFDDNANKALGGRVLFTPWDFLTLGFSVFYGDIAVKKNLDKTHASYGFSLAFEWDNFNLTGEFFDSKIRNIEQQASYVQASYTFLGRITPHIKYEYLNVLEQEDYDWHDLGVGVNFKVMDGLFLKAEFHSHLRGRDNSEVYNNMRRYNEFVGQVAIAF